MASKHVFFDVIADFLEINKPCALLRLYNEKNYTGRKSVMRFLLAIPLLDLPYSEKSFWKVQTLYNLTLRVFLVGS